MPKDKQKLAGMEGKGKKFIAGLKGKGGKFQPIIATKPIAVKPAVLPPDAPAVGVEERRERGGVEPGDLPRLRAIRVGHVQLQLRGPHQPARQRPPPEPTFPRRLDLTALFGAIAKIQIYKGLEGSLHYYYRRHDSNIATYDFTSHIFGAQLAYRY